MSLPSKVLLKPRKAQPFFNRHPWVYQGAIARVEGKPAPGTLVRVESAENKFIAHGLYNPHSQLSVRLYSWDENQPFDDAMIVARLERAIRFRHGELGLGDPRGACRLIFSEADGLSGLLVDRYADILVLQYNSLALTRFAPAIEDALKRIIAPRGMLRRTDRTIAELEGMTTEDGVIHGEIPSGPMVIVENALELLVDLQGGQKTGAFLDQRDNRQAFCQYTSGRDLLDLFCYTGAFGLHAMTQGKAKSLLGIDVSAGALGLARQNAERLGISATFVQEPALQAMQRLRQEGQRFGALVCDPPKFARNAAQVDQATKGYERINSLAMELLRPGGVMLTCSCSGHVHAEDFTAILADAAKKVGRDIQILEHRGQAPDHPVSLFCLESNYLKAVLLRAVD